MNDLISRKALCEFCLNTKDRTVDANDIMRFPSAEPERRGMMLQIIDKDKNLNRIRIQRFFTQKVKGEIYLYFETFNDESGKGKMIPESALIGWDVVEEILGGSHGLVL